jgi:VanZ like family
LKKLKNILFNPFLIYLLISFLECIPVKSPIIYSELPKEGDNFRSKSNEAVYYYSKDGKYSYTSQECYFNLGNPPFSATYEQGGIKMISDEIVNKIPLLGSMCEEVVVAKIIKKDIPFSEKYLTVNYFLFSFSTFSHVFFYMLLAFSIIYHQSKSNKNYWFVFITCFIGGVFLELIQHFFIEGRNASFDDVLMNSIGAIIAILFYYLMNKKSLFLDINSNKRQ